MSQLKYTFVGGDTISKAGRTLTRIKALKDFGDVLKDDLGGYIQQESNLDNRLKDENNNDLLCWIYSDGLTPSVVFGSVYDIATVSQDGKVTGNAEACDKFIITGTGEITDNALALENGVVDGGIMEDTTKIVGDAQISASGILRGNAKMSRFGKLYDTGIAQGSSEISNNERVFDTTIGL